MISDLDFPEVREVDLKLIELARALSGKIVTNDFNLNKVAQLRGVAVLNINELANSLKPVVLPGEIMKVFILKEGKEFNQGVAYLDDGTMVVVDNARKLIGKTIDVVVTSVLQTTAGKMIFGRFVDPSVAGGAGQRPAGARRTAAAPARGAGAAAADARLGGGVGRRDGHGGRARPHPEATAAWTGRCADSAWASLRFTGGGRSSFSFPPSASTPPCSARCRWARAWSIGAGISRTAARACGRG